MDQSAVGKPLLFLADDTNNVVDILLQARKNKVVGQITGLNGPGGLATDTSGNLYIPNYGGATGGNVVVYAPPYTGLPVLTLSDAGYSPFVVAVSSSGVVAVVNFCNAPSCAISSASVNFYAKNSTMPCATLTNPNVANLVGGSFDRSGNLFTIGQGSAPSYSTVVGEIKGGCGAKSIELLTTDSPIGPAGGLHVDRADRIAVGVAGGSSSSPPLIITFRHPKTGSLGNPVSTTPLTSTGNYCAFDFGFLASGRNLYVVGCSNVTQKYGFPVGGAAKATIGIGAIGVAAVPPLVP